jgi:hypothetical protein
VVRWFLDGFDRELICRVSVPATGYLHATGR